MLRKLSKNLISGYHKIRKLWAQTQTSKFDGWLWLVLNWNVWAFEGFLSTWRLSRPYAYRVIRPRIATFSSRGPVMTLYHKMPKAHCPNGSGGEWVVIIWSFIFLISLGKGLSATMPWFHMSSWKLSTVIRL